MPDTKPLTTFGDARIGLMAILFAAPLAFGAVLSWAWGGLAVAGVAVLLLWAARSAYSGTVRVTWSPLYCAGLAVLVVAFVQLLTASTMDHIGTREALIKFAAYATVFFLAQQLFENAPPSHWRALGIAVAIYTFAMAAFAIVQFFASPGLLYGIIRPQFGGTVFGPYVYHNAYAGLMEMMLPIGVGAMFGSGANSQSRNLWLFAFLVSISSILLSGSRGGLVVVLVQVVIFCVLVWVAGDTRQRRWVPVAGVALVILAGLLFAYMDSGDVWKRWRVAAASPELELHGRYLITLDTLRMSRANLSAGVGLGAFETAYTKHQTLLTDGVVDYAHNDYAQFLAELGIAGWIILPVSIAVLLWLMFRRLRHRVQHPAEWLKLGAAVGACGMLVHSIGDFNLHIPANAAWFAFVIGLATLPAVKETPQTPAR